MIPPALLNTVTLGDCREVGALVPDESLDGIFTDPPYHDEFIWVWPWLSKFAMRTLKPGGLVFTYTGKHALPEVVTGLASAGLQYFWQYYAVQLNSNQRYFKRKVISVVRPILAYYKPLPDGSAPASLNWVVDGRKSIRDKKFHDWGQGANVPSYYVDRLTRPGDILCDPFCGGGQMPAVFKTLSRPFVTFELIQIKAETAAARLALISPDMFTAQEAEAIASQSALITLPDGPKRPRSGQKRPKAARNGTQAANGQASTKAAQSGPA